MAALALALLVLYASLAFGARAIVQFRRTGSTGFIGISGRPGSPGWLGGVLFAAAIGLILAAPLLHLAGAIKPFAPFEEPAVQALGVALYCFGLAGTLVAQRAMGSSWRVGVDTSERTDLVTAGPFALVRNPIFAAMIPTSVGLTLMVPSVVAIGGLLALVVALHLQVRVVEEPYLAATHGQAYADYAGRVGRFVPGMGRLRPRGR